MQEGPVAAKVAGAGDVCHQTCVYDPVFCNARRQFYKATSIQAAVLSECTFDVDACKAERNGLHLQQTQQVIGKHLQGLH